MLENHANIAVRDGRGLDERTITVARMRTTQTEQNRIIAQEFRIKYTAKIFDAGH